MKVYFVQNGRMLIHWAALGGHEDLVAYLLSLGVSVDPTDDVSIINHKIEIDRMKILT